MATSAADLLAGPIVRRATADGIAVWCAVSGAIESVALLVWRDTLGPRPTSPPLARVEAELVRLAPNLTIALADLSAEPGGELLSDAIYSYDLEFTGPGGARNLGELGLLQDGLLEGPYGRHPHLALGYESQWLPSFALPPARVADLVVAQGSCRRPYARGRDALAALDDLIARDRTDPNKRPHLFAHTGDQIYADDIAPEMLRWMMKLASDSFGSTSEQLRVGLGNTAGPDEDPRNASENDVTTFPVTERNFPAGRRQRLCARAANLTSGDASAHALSLGEYCAHYLMSWCNVSWPSMDAALQPGGASDAAVLLSQRRDDLDEFATRWFTGEAQREQQRTSSDRHRELHEQHGDRITAAERRFHSLWLTPEPLRAIDSELATDDAIELWQERPYWSEFWGHRTPPGDRPGPPIASTPEHRLARLLTPSWLAGDRHYRARVSQAANGDTVIEQDSVLWRLQQLRVFYDALPAVRRALANVPNYMMFDDHEVTDDWNITRTWSRRVNDRALGRDVLRNGLSAFLLFQAWGNTPERYRANASTPERHALEQLGKLFFTSAAPLAAGPANGPRNQLERLFGLGDAPLPEREQVAWSFSLTGPGFELITLDNRTRRGFETSNSPPANVSAQALLHQISREPPSAGDRDELITFVIAPMPALGFPPIELIGQPFINELTEYHDDPYSVPRNANPDAWANRCALAPRWNADGVSAR